MKRFLTIIVGVLLFWTLLLNGCGSDGSSPSNPIAPLGAGTSPSTTSVVFRILPPADSASPESSPGLAGSILAQAAVPPSVAFTLRLVNSGVATNPVTTLTKTVAATASGTGYAAIATFAELPLQTVIGDVAITGGTLNGFSQYRGAMDLVSGPQNVLDLAASGTRSLPDLKAQVLEWAIADTTSFASLTGLLVNKIDTAFAGKGIVSGSSYDQAFGAFSGKALQAPGILTRTPGINGTGVATVTTVVMTFDTPMNSSTFSGGAFSVKNGATAVSGALAFSNGSQTLTFTPDAPLAYATNYTVTLLKTVANTYGASFSADVTWTFTTVSAPVVTGSAQELIISEVSTCQNFTNEARWIEIYNNSPSAIDLADYSLKTRAYAANNAGIPDMVFSLPTLSVASGSFVIVRVKAFATYQDGLRIVHLLGASGEYPFWNTNGYVDLIRKSDGQTVDFVSFGTNTTPPTTASAWSGSAFPALPSVRGKSIVRSRSLTDTNTSADWTLHSWPTPGGPNDVANANDTDGDADGIPDGCEVSGSTFNGLPLAAWGAQAGRKDVFIHIDHMTSSHLGLIPKVEALDKVVAAFAAKQWAIHFDVGTLIGKYNLDGKSHEVPFAQYMWLGTQAGSANLYSYKAQYLDLAKRQIFHYCVFANQQNGSSSTGRGEMPGNDFMVNLGGVNFTSTASASGYFTPADLSNYLINEQASIVMHEFGHNLGLNHGGNEARNYKPSYLSIMNYLYSWYGLPTVTDTRSGDRYYFQKWSESGYSQTDPWFLNYVKLPNGSWGSKNMHNNQYSSAFVLDYSNGQGSALNEGSLDETVGLNQPGSTPVDWDGDGSSAQTLTNYDINPSDDGGSNTAADTLSDNDDWNTVAIYFATRTNDFFSRRASVMGTRRFSFQTDDREPVPDCHLISLHGIVPVSVGTR